MTQPPITPAMIIADYQDNTIIDLQMVAKSQELQAVSAQMTGITETVNHLNYIRLLSNNVNTVFEGVPIRFDPDGTMHSISSPAGVVKRAHIKKNYRRLNLQAPLNDTRNEPFNYLLELFVGTKLEKRLYGEYDNWTDFELVESMALNFLKNGRLPNVTRYEYFIDYTFTIGSQTVTGSHKIGPDKVRADELAFTLNQVFGENTHKVSAVLKP